MSGSPDDRQRALVGAGLAGLAVALLVAGFLAARPSTPERAVERQQRQPLPRGPAVPAFDLPRLGGGSARLSDLRGKVVMIDFWATWCPPCRAEMPWLLAIAKRYESKGVAFVAIAEDDPPTNVQLVTDFAQANPGLERFAVLGDPDIESQYGVTSLPTLFIVDGEGLLVRRFQGATTEAQVAAVLDQLVE